MGEVALAQVTCGELLNDLLEYADSNIKASTARVWKLVIEATIRPYFGEIRATKLTTEKLKEFRRKRRADGRSEATANRELSILRTALHRGRKCTPAKVTTIPYFPMIAETHVRQGFLSDEQYEKLRDSIVDYLKPLFVAAYFTGVRLGELKAIQWEQVDWEQGVHYAGFRAHKDRVRKGRSDSRRRHAAMAVVVKRKRRRRRFRFPSRGSADQRVSKGLEKCLRTGGRAGVEVS